MGNFFDPNKVLENKHYNQLSTFLNLSVNIPERIISEGDLKDIEYTDVLQRGDNNGNFEASYVNISFTDLGGGAEKNKSLFGVTDVDISFDTSFHPVVTINFVDVKGACLFNRLETGLNSTSEDAIKNSRVFFESLFHFPYPIFTLTAKGYYGSSLEYDLHVNKFNAAFDSNTGNYNITVSFIGYMYGCLSDIPMSYVLLSPYLLDNNNPSWDNSDKIPTSMEFLRKYKAFKNVDESVKDEFVKKDRGVADVSKTITKNKTLEQILNIVERLEKHTNPKEINAELYDKDSNENGLIFKDDTKGHYIHKDDAFFIGQKETLMNLINNIDDDTLKEEIQNKIINKINSYSFYNLLSIEYGLNNVTMGGDWVKETKKVDGKEIPCELKNILEKFVEKGFLKKVKSRTYDEMYVVDVIDNIPKYILIKAINEGTNNIDSNLVAFLNVVKEGTSLRLGQTSVSIEEKVLKDIKIEGIVYSTPKKSNNYSKESIYSPDIGTAEKNDYLWQYINKYYKDYKFVKESLEEHCKTNNKYTIYPIKFNTDTIKRKCEEGAKQLEQNYSSINQELIEIFSNIMGFKPTVKNVCKFLFKHLGCFAETLKDVYQSCINNNKKIGSNYFVDFDRKKFNITPPFPGVSERRDGTSSTNETPTVLSKIYPYIAEYKDSSDVQFIERMYQNIQKISDDVVEMEESEKFNNDGDSTKKCNLPSDIILENNPYILTGHSRDVNMWATHIASLLGLRISSNIKYGIKDIDNFIDYEFDNIDSALSNFAPSIKEDVYRSIATNVNLKDVYNMSFIENNKNDDGYIISNHRLMYIPTEYKKMVDIKNVYQEGNRKMYKYGFSWSDESNELTIPETTDYADIDAGFINICNEGIVKNWRSGSGYEPFIKDAMSTSGRNIFVDDDKKITFIYNKKGFLRDKNAKLSLDFSKGKTVKLENGNTKRILGVLALNNLHQTNYNEIFSEDTQNLTDGIDWVDFKSLTFNFNGGAVISAYDALKIGAHMWVNEWCTNFVVNKGKESVFNDIYNGMGFESDIVGNIKPWEIVELFLRSYCHKPIDNNDVFYFIDEYASWYIDYSPLFISMFSKWATSKEEKVKIYGDIEVYSLSKYFNIKEYGENNEFEISVDDVNIDTNNYDCFTKKIHLLYFHKPDKEIRYSIEDIIKYVNSAIGGKNLKGNKIVQSIYNSEESLETRTAMYYDIKNICDKYMYSIRKGNLDYKELGTNSNAEYSKMKYLDSFMKEIGDESLINPDTLEDLMMDCIYNAPSMTFIQFLAKLAEDNKFLFLTLPMNIVDGSDDSWKEAFGVKSWIQHRGVSNIQNSYIFFKQNEESFICNDTAFVNDSLQSPEDISCTDINAFDVDFGSQNANFFKSINVDMDGSVATVESIANTLMLSNKGQDGNLNMFKSSMSLYDIFKNRSYKCSVEMMGDMSITPFMFFNLKNTPMYRGVYRIINVKHKITPNDFSTTFTGVKVSKYKAPESKTLGFSRSLLDTVINRSGNTNSHNNGDYSDEVNGKGRNYKLNFNIKNFVDRVYSFNINRSVSYTSKDDIGIKEDMISEIKSWGNIKMEGNIEEYLKTSHIRIVEILYKMSYCMHCLMKGAKFNLTSANRQNNTGHVGIFNNANDDNTFNIQSTYLPCKSQHERGFAIDLQSVNIESEEGYNNNLKLYIVATKYLENINQLIWENNNDGNDGGYNDLPRLIHIGAIEPYSTCGGKYIGSTNACAIMSYINGEYNTNKGCDNYYETIYHVIQRRGNRRIMMHANTKDGYEQWKKNYGRK